MSQGIGKISFWPVKRVKEMTRWTAKTPMGLVIVGAAVAPLLVFDWTPSDAALPDPKIEAFLSSTTVPYLPVHPVEEEDFPPPEFKKQVKIGKGDTLIALLSREGMSSPEAHRAVKALSKYYDPRQLRPGQEVTLTLTPRTSAPDDTILTGLTLRPSIFNEVSLERVDGDQFRSQKRKIAVERKLVRSEGTILSSLYVAASKAGVPAPVLMELIRIYSWDVDFQRGIRAGDKFEVMFEKLFTDDGEFARYGNILYGNLILRNEENPLYRHKTPKGFTDYFDKNGQSARKALMRTPINGARLSSGFGKRRHPILGYTKMHRGLDFAAPSGTPIYAAGDGVVIRRGRNGGYGNYIRIRHNSEFDTAYAHMRRYHPKVRRGSRVRQGQIIGYVGTTGRSTGPHLHYEILKNNRQVNPLRIKMPSGVKLKGKYLTAFKAVRDKADQLYDGLPAVTKVAKSGKTLKR